MLFYHEINCDEAVILGQEDIREANLAFEEAEALLDDLTDYDNVNIKSYQIISLFPANLIPRCLKVLCWLTFNLFRIFFLG